MQDYIPIRKDINDNIEDVIVKQHDNLSRFIHFQILDKDLNSPMSLENCFVRLYVETGETTGEIINGYVADGENGIIAFLLTNRVTQNPGTFRCEIRLTNPDDNAILSTNVFNLVVKDSIFDDDAYEGEPELGALQEALNGVDGMDARINILSKSIDEKLDSQMHVKPVWLGESDGFAAQGMTHISENRYLITFNDLSNATNSKIAVFDKRSGIIAEKQATFGHANTVAMDENEIFYIPADDGLSLYRFMMSLTEESGQEPEITITTLEPLTLASGVKVESVFDHNGKVYAYGEKQEVNYIWELGTENNIFIMLPEEAPRVNQSWATDGTWLYWLKSSPNAVAVFDFSNGAFIRWIDIGDFVGSTMMIGEVESLCAVDGRIKLISQYYYPNTVDTKTRFWLFSDAKLSKDIPSNQQHVYPNDSRRIYVSNSLPNGIEVKTNNIKLEDQTGSIGSPYPSLETAIYAAMATSKNLAEITIEATGEDYEIDDLVIRAPSMSIFIKCEGNVKFSYLHVSAGNVMITGNCSFARISTSPRASLTIDGGTFTATGLINLESPYLISGYINILNARYTGGSNDIIFKFNPGATGVVGFTDGSPRSNSTQQLNLTLYNVRNAGGRDRWTSIYSGGTAITIGTAITTTLQGFNVLTDTIYRIRWCAESDGGYYNTIVHVNGDTIVDMPCMITVDGWIIHRIVRMRFRPRVQNNNGNWINGDITVISVTDYTISGGAIAADVTSTGAIPNTTTISAIDVRGY